MNFPRPPAVKTRPAPVFTRPPTGGEIVPYRPQGTPLQDVQVINPVPRGTLTPPKSAPSPALPKPDVIDAEIIPTPPKSAPSPARRPVVDSNAAPSSQARYPDRYPNIPNPLQAWKTLADYEAWRNGMNKSQIDEEREAYEFTKDWGKTGGMLYPFTEYGPRTPILSDNLDKANKYRARNGLPAIDRFGYEQAQPVNPGLQPGSAFGSNPFNVPVDDVIPTKGTPSNFDGSPYDFSIDPETGLPFTDLQKRRGDELGRPPWHINPVTGNPWGSDEPGTPITDPFQGYPGGAIKMPVPNYATTPARWLVVLELSHSYSGARGRGRYEYYVDSATAPSVETVDIGPQEEAYGPSGGSARVLDFRINGNSVGTNGSGDVTADGTWENFGVRFGPAYPVGFSASDPTPGADPTATPFGTPSPLPTSQPKPSPERRPLPSPVQDPRVVPDVLTPPAINPGAKPNDSPYSPARPTQPNSRPGTPVIPNIPGQLAPPYSPVPFPRSSPVGAPQPSLDPATQPSPSRPINPAPYTQTDRPKNPPVNPGPDSPDCNPCPDPCPETELKEIQYKEFKGCFVTPSGAPDRFVIKRISVPSVIADFARNALDNLADIKALECNPCCYWDMVEGDPKVLFAGIPRIVGQDFAIPKGVAKINVTYNPIDALTDNTLRSLKRIASDGDPENTFVNVAAIHLINASGFEVDTKQIWTVGTEISVPFEYREVPMTLRIMPKSSKVNFTISDSGYRWIQRVE